MNEQVSVSVDDGSTKTEIAGGPWNDDASWSSDSPKLAWVTDRNGPIELWVRSSDGSERPAVTPADFPVDSTSALVSPSLSPDGERVIYARMDNKTVRRLWISSLSGGSPVRLTNSEPGHEYFGAWSPDGGRFAYLQVQGGILSLMTVKTRGGVAPIVLKDGVKYEYIDWSPTGEWIVYADEKGWNLISPDGKASKVLGKIHTIGLIFSKDGKLLYGIRTGEAEADQDHATLFSLDPMKLRQKVIKELDKDRVPSRRDKLQPRSGWEELRLRSKRFKMTSGCCKATDSPASGTRSRGPSISANPTEIGNGSVRKDEITQQAACNGISESREGLSLAVLCPSPTKELS